MGLNLPFPSMQLKTHLHKRKSPLHKIRFIRLQSLFSLLQLEKKRYSLTTFIHFSSPIELILKI